MEFLIFTVIILMALIGTFIYFSRKAEQADRKYERNYQRKTSYQSTDYNSSPRPAYNSPPTYNNRRSSTQYQSNDSGLLTYMVLDSISSSHSSCGTSSFSDCGSCDSGGGGCD